MDNPYKKPNDNDIHRDDRGRVMFFRFTNCRWSWFEASKGELWHSRERHVYMHRYARDYAFQIFERYQRRFGYLSTTKAADFVKKIMRRWDWWNEAFVHVPPLRWAGLLQPDGPFCPIGKAGWLNRDGSYREYECQKCGAALRIKKGFVINRWNDEMHDIWPVAYSGFDSTECSSDECRKTTEFIVEALSFMNGKHRKLAEAKKIGVLGNRPMKKFIRSTADEKVIIASSSLLDFEARLIQRQEKIAGNSRNAMGKTE